MTGAAILDTHAMFKRLAATGMPEPQAEVVVDLIRERQEQVVTREVLRYELDALEDRLSGRVDDLDRGLSTRIDQAENNLRGRIDALEKRIDRLDQRIDTLGKDLIIRLGGMLAAAVVIVGALVALF